MVLSEILRGSTPQVQKTEEVLGIRSAVVVAQHDQEVLELISSVLADQGHIVIGASNVLDALREVRANMPPVVVLDQFLESPTTDVTKALVTADPYSPVVVLTSTDHNEGVRLAKQTGIPFFVPLPLEDDRLEQCVIAGAIKYGRRTKRVFVPESSRGLGFASPGTRGDRVDYTEVDNALRVIRTRFPEGGPRIAVMQAVNEQFSVSGSIYEAMQRGWNPGCYADVIAAIELANS